ncbi:hypothetical protein C8Q77DRAFT_244449 [Trametes polyzona]|nr:hypothetical protein C8Q77DRAFT_244449 [Trametes polyzona]
MAGSYHLSLQHPDTHSGNGGNARTQRSQSHSRRTGLGLGLGLGTRTQLDEEAAGAGPSHAPNISRFASVCGPCARLGPAVRSRRESASSANARRGSGDGTSRRGQRYELLLDRCEGSDLQPGVCERSVRPLGGSWCGCSSVDEDGRRRVMSRATRSGGHQRQAQRAFSRPCAGVRGHGWACPAGSGSVPRARCGGGGREATRARAPRAAPARARGSFRRASSSATHVVATQTDRFETR